MLEHTRKHHIKQVEARFTGTPERIRRLRELAKEAGVAMSDSGKAVADSTAELTNQASSAASAAWESTKEAASAAADSAAKLTDSAAKSASEATDKTVAAASEAAEATKAATTQTVEAAKEGLA